MYGLDIVNRFRPVVPKQPRQRAIGKQAPAGLAFRAVVALVRGVDDALHRRAADRARLFESAMNGHALVKGGDLLGKTASQLLTQAIDPEEQSVSRRAVEAFH